VLIAVWIAGIREQVAKSGESSWNASAKSRKCNEAW